MPKKKKNNNKVLIVIVIILAVFIIIYLFVPFTNNSLLSKIFSPICGIKKLYQGEEYLPTWCQNTNINTPVSNVNKDEGADDQPVGLANPAAVKCENDGGTLENHMTTDGDAALCVFDDESICNQWAYYRGECKVGECFKECRAKGTKSEGWYSSCTKELIKWEKCGDGDQNDDVDEDDDVDEVDEDLDAGAILENGNIKISYPTADTQLSSPFKVEGEARVFENKVYVRVTNSQGSALIEEDVTINSVEMGQFKEFDIELNYEFNLTKDGYVEVYSLSAKDGTEENLIKIPVKF